MTFSGAILNFGGVGAQNEGDKNTLRIQSKLSREHAQSQTQTKTWIYMKDCLEQKSKRILPNGKMVIFPDWKWLKKKTNSK